MSNVVQVRQLSKIYGKTHAIDNVSFTIEENKIYGLLGRNGAGKTTIMHIITAQLFETSGEVTVFGEHPYENNNVLRQICFIKESQKYPDNFKVADVLQIAPTFFPNWDKTLAESLVEDFRLPLKQKVKNLSRGMLSSVGIIVGLASRAPLTIFDEPYIGLDAVARTMFYDRLLEDYAEHPRTIILSTHLIDEVSQLLEHVIVIDQGRILINEETETLRGRAVNITGATAKVEAFTQGREIIHKEPFGGMSSITIMGGLSTEDRKQAAGSSLELTPVSLQQMIVHLTSSSGDLDRKAGEGK
ncbi:ABC transporter ATP-binding protein [Paenibacillaceae bacterium]|nr:ABC transporter ATP-binding protein [Paenibacillaceae bacterium]